MGEPARSSPRRRLTGADLLVVVIAVIALIAGALVLVLASGFTATLLACVAFGVAAIALVSLAFLMVGESEDRDYRNQAP